MTPRPLRALQLAIDLPVHLLAVFRARRALSSTLALPEMLATMTPALPRERCSDAHRARTVRAVRWATRLFPTNPRGDCLVRSLALYSELRARGWAVEFVSGVRREGEQVLGHAWVELDGEVLPELRERDNQSLYRETFRYPGRLAASADTGERAR